jgi:hypothetical protein
MVQGPAFLFIFLSVGAVALFGFLAVAAWSSARQLERESYYRNDMLKKLADSQSSGAVATIEYLNEEQRAKRVKDEEKKREGFILGGLINAAIGVALMAFLGAITHGKPVYLVGLIPLSVGIALLVYVYLLVPRK